MKSPALAFSASLMLCMFCQAALAEPAERGNRDNRDNELTVTLTAKPPSYAGACPVTIAFEGTITGNPGRNVSYQFNRVIGGAPSSTVAAPGVLDAAGQLKVNDSVVVDVAHAGAETNTLDVDSGAAKASVAFSVTCTGNTETPNPNATPPSGGGGLSRIHIPTEVFNGLATPTPTPAPGHIGTIGIGMTLEANPLGPPTGLTNTTDPGVCADHIPVPIFGPLLCAGAIKDGLMLIWNWKPVYACSDCPKDVDGFRIYRVDGGQHTLAATQTGGKDSTGYGPPKPGDGFSGKCYTVTAYKGKDESTDSNRFCVGGMIFIGTKTETLSPAHTRSRRIDDTHQTGALCKGWTHHSDISEPTIIVGYTYYSASDWPCTVHYNTYIRGATYFDLSALAGKKIWKATLHLGPSANSRMPKLGNDQASYYFHDPATSSCLTEIGTGKAEWWTDDSWMELDVFETRTFYGPLDFDVTKQVGAWLQGISTNYGFAFKGEEEGDKELDYKFACISNLRTPTLTIEYFP